ncbi:MAG: SUF system Fe-S cluster assembly protein [Alphaproteobacteria bacterium]|nr:MAG: SUF system Fe-S cluster assembly protein [Alphaproteobacteria bacterium]
MTDRGDGNERERASGRPVWHGPTSGFLDRFLRASAKEDEERPQDPPADDDVPAAEARREETTSEDAPAEPDRPAAPDGADTPAARLRERVIEALRHIYDPEIPVNLYDLGLIYAVEVTDEGDVSITMTLTTPHCPVAESMPYEVEARVLGVEGVRDVAVHLVWDPPWDMSMMSDEARLELGLI